MPRQYATPQVRNSLAAPTPRDLEAKSQFLARYTESDAVRRKFVTPAKRALAGERAWNTAKMASLVSIVTSEDSFLLFGALEPR